MGNWLSSTPDDHEVFETQRRKPREYGEKRRQCLDQAQEARQRNDPGAAKQLVMEAERYEELMKEANQKAADAIYNHLNAPGKQPNNTIDLHGLYVHEALDKVQQAVDVARKTKKAILVVIVGKGNNSINGIPKIKPAVQEFAKKNALRYHLNAPNAGCITLEFDVDQPSFCVIC